MLILLTAKDIPHNLNNINIVTDIYMAYQDAFITNEAS